MYRDHGHFSPLFGAGAVVAIGVIILPILMSLGIPKVLSVVSFMLSIGAGMFLNPVLFGQYTAFFLDARRGRTTYPYEEYVRWGGIAPGGSADFHHLPCAVLHEKEKRRFTPGRPDGQSDRKWISPRANPFLPRLFRCSC